MFTLGLVAINTGIKYSWEYCVSFWFDWRIVTREYPFKWPLVRSTTSTFPLPL